MSAYNLTEAQKNILRRMAEAIDEGFENRFVYFCNSKFQGAILEAAGKPQRQVGCAQEDLQMLHREGLVHFVQTGGVVSQAGLDAVNANFVTLPPGPQIAIGAVVASMTGGTIQTSIGTGNVQQAQAVNYAMLHEHLKRDGVPQAERNDLENILDGLGEGNPVERPSLMQRGREWLKRNAASLGEFAGGLLKGYFQ